MTIWEATPDRTWFVGDLLDDVEAGRRAGCLTILFDSGGETDSRQSSILLSTHDAADQLVGPDEAASYSRSALGPPIALVPV